MRKFEKMMLLLPLLTLAACAKTSDPAISVYTRDTTSGTRDGFMEPTKIEDLEKECNAMCAYAENNLKRAFAYYENEIKPEDFVPIDDDTVDHYERTLEGECLDCLVREHLYAGSMVLSAIGAIR